MFTVFRHLGKFYVLQLLSRPSNIWIDSDLKSYTAIQVQSHDQWDQMIYSKFYQKRKINHRRP